MADFWAKQSDTAPPLKQVLVDGNGDPADLQNTEVKFLMRPIGDTEATVDAAATIEQVGDGSDGSKGRVSYAWGANDLDVSGGYYGEWQVTYADDSVETFPNDRYVTIAVIDDLEATVSPPAGLALPTTPSIVTMTHQGSQQTIPSGVWTPVEVVRGLATGDIGDTVTIVGESTLTANPYTTSPVVMDDVHIEISPTPHLFRVGYGCGFVTGSGASTTLAAVFGGYSAQVFNGDEHDLVVNEFGAFGGEEWKLIVGDNGFATPFFEVYQNSGGPLDLSYVAVSIERIF